MMIRVLSTLAAIALLAGLSACDKEKEVDPPAELVDMKPRIEIDKVWSTGVGGDSKALRLGLRPASDGERLTRLRTKAMSSPWTQERTHRLACSHEAGARRWARRRLGTSRRGILGG